MKKYLYLFSLLLMLSFTGCRDLFFKDEPANDPVSVYFALTEDYIAHYGPQSQRGVNLDSLQAVYRTDVGDASSDEDLWVACVGFLSHLNDGHVNLVAPGREAYNSNFWFETRTDDGLFDIEMINQSYFGGGLETGEYEDWYEGMLNDSVIYIHFPWVADNLLILPEILEKHSGAKGLILDLRHNRGGDFTYAFSAFGVLTQEEQPVFSSRTKNGPGANDWTEWYQWNLQPDGEYFNHPIVVLMDRYTISAGERAVMALASLPNVTLLGDTTNGSQSTMIGRELPNGWTYTIPTQETVMFDGFTYEGIGIPPDLRVMNTQTQVDAGQDAVLEAALALF